MNSTFDMVAKTFQGLEAVLADELRALGAQDVAPGKRMVSFRGDLELLYRANMCCRTALRILKPFLTFDVADADALYATAKEFEWSKVLRIDQSFSIDTTVFSEEFRNSQYVTYRIKDAIVDWFRDRDEAGRRPRVSVEGADIYINVHVAGTKVTLSLDSSGESLHRRGWRVAQTEAPINEVLAAGILLIAGYDGSKPFVDPMCGSGTFAIEAAMIAAGINPGVYRNHFAFENWEDFDAELLERVYNDDSNERIPEHPIIAADLNAQAIEIARNNARGAAVEKYITFERRPIEEWTEAPAPAGWLVTNPPYGRRIGSDDMFALYKTIGTKFKRVFTGYHCWVIGYKDEYFHEIGLAPSEKIAVNNGGLDCELRQYIIFEGNKREFRAAGGKLKKERPVAEKSRSDRRRKETPGERFGRAFRKDGDRPARKDGDRPFRKTGDRPFRKEGDREGAQANENAERRRKLVVGRQPSISADKEIVLNRPAWRVRKNKSDNTEN